MSEEEHVGIKSLLDAVGITAAQVYVNTSLMKLVLVMNFKKIFQVVTTADMDQDSAHMAAASKVPIFKPENDATLPKTKVMEGVTTELKFNSIKDAKKLLEAVKKRFGRNAATKKTQKNLLKQQCENFFAPSLEMLDQTYDRLQKLVSRLELLEEKLSQEDVNQKLLKSLSHEWNTHVVVWRNKVDLDTMSIDDLYNNLKVTHGAVNIAQEVNTAHGVSTASIQVNAAYSINIDNLSDVVIFSFFASQPNSPQLVHEDLEQIHPDDMEEMDLRWQMAMLTIRARRNQDNKQKESSRRSVPMETSISTTLVSCDGLGGYDWSDQAEKRPNYILMAFSSLSSDSKDLNKSELMVLGYKTDEFVNKHVVENCKAKSSEEEPKVVRKKDDALIIGE
uniref:Uncharacterized protein n=1 Tax=Tanacetum cinerariifolium TaxID=118510 RepID=A0A699J2I9_TANCI|nr:hypothetical protein [Tanacetum cinerariifolium]